MDKTKTLARESMEVRPDSSYEKACGCAAISIDECRKYLGETKLTDKQIEELRDALCIFVDKVLDNYFNKLLQ